MTTPLTAPMWIDPHAPIPIFEELTAISRPIVYTKPKPGQRPTRKKIKR